MEAPAQERIGHYVLEAPLGRGSMGAVFLARDERIGRRVALKQLQIKADFEDSTSAAEYYRRLQREAEVCGALQHPNIVTLYDVGYLDDRISYLALEYVPGESLLERLRRYRPKPLPLEMALAIAADILKGLVYAHGKGIVHRDIKPANILLSRDGTTKIADFGIARPQQSSMTAAGALLGTPNYMPPEQVKGIPATPRSDLFSLGVLLFEMVTAAKPFASGEMAAVLENIVRMPTPSAAALNPEVSPELDALIQRLTAKSPEERLASAREALTAVEGLRSGTTAPLTVAPEEQTIAVSEPPSAARRSIRSGTAIPVIVLALLAAAAPCVYIWNRIDDRPTAQISPEQLKEFAAKREALRAADELFDTGKYAESQKAYEAYLAKYPHSVAAREGAAEAKAALEEQKTAQAKRPAAKEPEKKGGGVLQGIRRGVRRIFRGK